MRTMRSEVEVRVESPRLGGTQCSRMQRICVQVSKVKTFPRQRQLLFGMIILILAVFVTLLLSRSVGFAEMCVRHIVGPVSVSIILPYTAELLIEALVQILLGLSTASLVLFASTPRSRLLALISTTNWLHMAMCTVRLRGYVTNCDILDVFEKAEFYLPVTLGYIWGWLYLRIHDAMQPFQTRPFMLRLAHRLWWASVLFLILSLIFSQMLALPFLLVLALALLLQFLVFAILMGILEGHRRLIKQAAEVASGGKIQEVQEAKCAVHSQMLMIFMIMMGLIGHGHLFVDTTVHVFSDYFGIIVECVWYEVAAVCNARAMTSWKAQIADAWKHRQWFDASVAWHPNSNACWQEKVNDLASRGFTVDALLEFYGGLGTKFMLHYIAGRHTTLDVVRMAIIPLSRDAQSDLATVMMHGVPRRPNAIVTHSWSNLFRDLVAAIVADALGEQEFAMISYLLEHDLEAVLQGIRGAGAQLRTYWVCAFCVNQHSGICSRNPHGTKDLVMCMLHPTCSCGFSKAWNDTPPITDAGRGIASEMNKFDEMIRYLSARDPEFRQIVAIDVSFTLFSRAWCISEIATSNAQGVKQCLNVKSKAVLDTSVNRLKDFRVEDMEASVPADKEQILASIKDTALFNKCLHSMLFDELFPAWHNLEEEDQMKRICWIIRWQTVCGDRPTRRGMWDEAVATDCLPLDCVIGNPQAEGADSSTDDDLTCWI
eukprot:TRINITY_DN8883_c0_g1_i1.p1 TRINITY_DN8883_c0_g1~~TRINITY_DN8883_c0_g1_i1.p1  ORF type:complete len:714 (+),score=75.44 TRINITY_DN8883_c0_g1_i1:114-2255(+)